MSAHSESARKDIFPRAPLIGAAVLLLLTVTGAGLSRMASGPVPADPAAPLTQRDLRFADRADGAVVVYQDGDSTPVSVVTGQAGFLRGTLRALVRERRLDGQGAQAPFRLAAWPDGRLTLSDPATGQHIELEAFGSDNVAVYAKLLTAQHGATP